MREVFKRLSKHWLAHNTRPTSSLASQDDILQFQERYGVRLPADFKEYVLRVNGNHLGETLETDSTGFSFLPLSAMQTEQQWSGGGYGQE
jgi:SMI1 / KNR4 family (SUKH-1)